MTAASLPFSRSKSRSQAIDADDGTSAPRPALGLVPRMKNQGYSNDQIDRRRQWLEKKTDAEMPLVAGHSLEGEELRGNIENPIGAVQMPLGVAGPLKVRGNHADGTFYVPLATTEGALVRSYERGMVAITRAAGAEVRILVDENRVSPMFHFADVGQAADFCGRLPEFFQELKKAAEATTRHGRLLRITPLISGRKVIVDFSFDTGDAHGMNMIVKATDAACRVLQGWFPGVEYHIFSGYNGEKRAAGSLLRGGKGKKVTAGVRLDAQLTRSMFRVSPEQMVAMWQATVLGHLHTGAMGYNGHYANGLTALFIATGQDVANVVNSAVGVTHFEVSEQGELYASVTLPSLTVATVGGGTALGTSAECLAMLGCRGSGQARKLAEITAATLLAGELSMGGAIAAGELVAAHESYGRNRPESPKLGAESAADHQTTTNDEPQTAETEL